MADRPNCQFVRCPLAMSILALEEGEFVVADETRFKASLPFSCRACLPHLKAIEQRNTWKLDAT